MENDIDISKLILKFEYLIQIYQFIVEQNLWKYIDILPNYLRKINICFFFVNLHLIAPDA